MKIVRFVAEPTAWRKAFVRRDEDEGSLPLIAIRAFTPTEREGGRISLYKLDNEDGAPSLAGAYWLMTKETFALIAIEEEELVAAGCMLHDDVPGDTYHTVINSTHVDLEVEDGEAAIKFARLFFEKGELLEVEKRDIKQAIANDNALEIVDFKKLTRKKNQQSVNLLCDLIHDEVLSLITPKMSA